MSTPHPHADPRLERLLLRWDQLCDQGQPPDPAELCRDCPELLPEFRKLLRTQNEFAHRPGGSTIDHTPTGDRPTPATDWGPTDWPGVPGYEQAGPPLVGGMGVVFPVVYLANGRREALKLLRLPPGGPGRARDAHRRFRREVELLTRLDHPNIVRLHRAGEWHELAYFAMEFVPAGGLHRHIDRFREDPRAAVTLVAKVARALHYLHANGIVHRDLKPANILLTEADEPKVADFGLAKIAEASLTLTRPGSAPGSPAYMAPEQWEGREVGPATDVWALGVTLYELLSGKTPFAAPSYHETRARAVAADPPPLTALPGVDAALEAVCRKCLEKAPARRYASAAELADDLEAWLAGEPRRMSVRPPSRWQRHRRKAIAFGVAAGFGLLVALGLILKPAPKVYIEDPFAVEQRHWDELSQRLTAGETITLLGETGPPTVWRWGLDGATSPVIDAPDEPFTVDCTSARLVELAPFPPAPSFVLRAEVRQRVAYDRGDVGVYFGHQRDNGRNSFYIASLAALGELAGQPKPILPLPTGVIPVNLDPAWPAPDIRPARKRTYNTTCRFWANLLELQDTAGEPTQRNLQLLGPKFIPRPGQMHPDAWHALVVKVTPQRLDFTLDDRPVGGVDLDHVARRLDPRAARVPKVRPPTGKLGLYLFHSRASFRRVSIAPLALPG